MTARVVYDGQLRCTATHLASGSLLETDAPTDNHGLGERFSPTDLLATALLSCAITTLAIRMNLGELPQWPLKGEVLKTMAGPPRRVARLEAVLQVQAQPSPEQQRLLEHIAHTCPVALSLHPDLDLDLRFVYGQAPDPA